jgi:hypothetical protein
MPRILKQTSGIKQEALCDAIRKKVGCDRPENRGVNHFNKLELHAILAKLIILEQRIEAMDDTRTIILSVAEEIKAALITDKGVA